MRPNGKGPYGRHARDGGGRRARRMRMRLPARRPGDPGHPARDAAADRVPRAPHRIARRARVLELLQIDPPRLRSRPSQGGAVTVSVYGSEAPGLASTTTEVVKAAVNNNGYDATAIASSINRAINSGVLVGVDFVEPKDINVKEESKAVGVYFTALLGDRTSPSWDLPVDSMVLNILGSIQTVIGIILILLVVFRSRLLKSFQER